MIHLEAQGSFEVRLAPQAVAETAGATGLARMSIVKAFHGDLEAASAGEMLSFSSADPGSAGYVAMEKVSGVLHGRHGSFVLQHSSTMDRGTPQQSIVVVPGSGTGQLRDLSGSMTVLVTLAAHGYRFDYQLPATPTGADTPPR